jgi:hypothetical protein
VAGGSIYRSAMNGYINERSNVRLNLGDRAPFDWEVTSKKVAEL